MTNNNWYDDEDHVAHNIEFSFKISIKNSMKNNFKNDFKNNKTDIKYNENSIKSNEDNIKNDKNYIKNNIEIIRFNENKIRDIRNSKNIIENNKNGIGNHENNFENDDEYRRAIKKAIRLLSVSPRTRHELKERLMRREFGFSPEIIDAVIISLERSSFIDDNLYATAYIYDKSTNALWGKRRIISELRRKGVDMLVIDKAFEDAEIDDNETAKAALRARYGINWRNLPPDEKRRAVGFLLRKGLSPSVLRDSSGELPGEYA